MFNPLFYSLNNLPGSIGPCLRFVGNGTENTCITQEFSLQNNSKIYPYTQYAVSLWVAQSGKPAAGALQVAFTDGNNNVLNDAVGNANSFTIPVASLSGAVAPFGGIFRTGRIPPSVVRLRLLISTPISSGGSILVQRLACAVPTQLYAGGPFVAVFSGLSPLAKGDSFELTISNAYNGKMQGLFARMFPMRAYGLVLPSSASATIPDSLIAVSATPITTPPPIQM